MIVEGGDGGTSGGGGGSAGTVAGEGDARTSNDAGDASFDDILADFNFSNTDSTEPSEADTLSEPEPSKSKPVDGEGDKKKQPEEDKKDNEEEEPIDPKDALIAALREEIANLSKAREAQEQTETELPPIVMDSGNYFPDDTAFNKALDDPKEFNKILDSVAANAAAKAREETLKTIPAVITPLVQTTIAVNMGVAQFYAKNPDLQEHKEFCGRVTNELLGKHPDWTLGKLFEETEKEVRRKLGLKRDAEERDRREVSKRPSFVPKGGGGRGSTPAGGIGQPQLTSLEKEISELLE
jgi:hypothetical protein